MYINPVSHENGTKTTSNSQNFVEAVLNKVVLFHDMEHEAYGSFEDQFKKPITCGLRDKRFIIYVKYLHHTVYKKGINAAYLESVLSDLEAFALFDRKQFNLHNRVGRAHDNSVELRLFGNKVARIIPGSWTIEDATLKFSDHSGIVSLPEPQRGGDINQLFDFVNITASEDRKLCIGYLVNSLLPEGPYPVLFINGPYGSGKSIATDFMKRIIDPNTQLLPMFPKKNAEETICIRAQREHVLHYDNLTYMTDSLANTFCQMSTKGSMSARTLYTNAGQTTFNICNPVILTSISDITNRPDLRSRAVHIYLKKLEHSKSKTPEEMERSFQTIYPFLLGCILDGLAEILKDEDISLVTQHRMLGFARNGERLAKVYGWEDGSFIKALDLKEENRANDAIENDVVASALLQIALNFTADITEVKKDWLLSKVHSLYDPRDFREVPKTTSAFTKTLVRLQDDLMKVGILIEEDRRTNERFVRITKTKSQISFDKVTGEVNEQIMISPDLVTPPASPKRVRVNYGYGTSSNSNSNSMNRDNEELGSDGDDLMENIFNQSDYHPQKSKTTSSMRYDDDNYYDDNSDDSNYDD